MSDPYDLQRFVDAQQPVFDTACAELRAGRKRSHWIWFVFPQIAGLGHSAMAHRFAISSIDEARAYLRHPLLGDRLRLCTDIVVALEGCSVNDVFGSPDDMKFRSSMTLFSRAGNDAIFDDCLRKYFGGVPDRATLERL